jgi:hypothetical protein
LIAAGRITPIVMRASALNVIAFGSEFGVAIRVGHHLQREARPGAHRNGRAEHNRGAHRNPRVGLRLDVGPSAAVHGHQIGIGVRTSDIQIVEPLYQRIDHGVGADRAGQ